MPDNLIYLGEIASHEYTYQLADLRTNEVVADIPMKSVTYSNVLSGIGDASGSIMINEDTSALFPKLYSSPGKMALYILRDGKVVWGGIVWKRSYNSDREVRLICKTFESYLYHRFQHVTKYWDSEDQLEIARWLLGNEESAPSYLIDPVSPDSPVLAEKLLSNTTAADVLIEVSTATSTRFRERTMFGYEFKTIGEELEQLAGLIDGFDWNVVIYQDENREIRRLLNFSYPTAGKSVDETLFLIAF